MSKFFFLLLFLTGLCLLSVRAQSGLNYTWWNNIHNWDGTSSWRNYMTFEPGAMGPNALPVPDLQIGRIDTMLTFMLAPETHFAKNDFTADLFTRVNIPIKKAVALQIWWVPIEYYKTDTVVRDFRAARTKEAEGTAVGDVYIGMLIPLVTDKGRWPDLLLGINLKTASGNMVEDARYTDAPGYFFDLSGGKDIALKSKNGWKIRPYASAGFYVYQTNRLDYYQNDAYMLGAGIDVKNSFWRLSAQYASYTGYFKNYDLPKVLRVEIARNIKNVTLSFRLQSGNQSYNFTSLRAGFTYNFISKKPS